MKPKRSKFLPIPNQNWLYCIYRNHVLTGGAQMLPLFWLILSSGCIFADDYETDDRQENVSPDSGHPMVAAIGYCDTPPEYSFCNGTALTSTLLVTAYHCVDGEDAEKLCAYFDYPPEGPVQKLPFASWFPVSREDSNGVVRANPNIPDRDIALVELSQSHQLTNYASIPSWDILKDVQEYPLYVYLSTFRRGKKSLGTYEIMSKPNPENPLWPNALAFHPGNGVVQPGDSGGGVFFMDAMGKEWSIGTLHGHKGKFDVILATYLPYYSQAIQAVITER